MGRTRRVTGTVTSIGSLRRSVSPESSAAVWWLSAAPGPARSTTAHSRAGRGTGPEKVAYTAGKTFCQSPPVSRARIAASVRPVAAACRRVTTPR